VEVSDFNMEYWRGHEQDAYYVIELEGEETLVGDLNGDCEVNLVDLAILLTHYGETGGVEYSDGDIDGDDDVDIADLAALLGHYGESCQD
jgi:hypothetical protein